MGVDCCFWIIPKDRTFRASASQFANLANALREGGWVPKPEAGGQSSKAWELLPGGEVVRKKPSNAHELDSRPFTSDWVDRLSQHELVLGWGVTNMIEAGVKYPFVFDPDPDGGPPYFYIYLIRGDGYFHYAGETVMPFPEQATKCDCGEQLSYWTGYAAGVGSGRIHHKCPKCGRVFDPSGIICDIQDGWTGETSPLRGGLTFRFAMAVNCHKYFPHEEEAARRFHLLPEFLELWRIHVNCPLEEVVTYD